MWVRAQRPLAAAPLSAHLRTGGFAPPPHDGFALGIFCKPRMRDTGCQRANALQNDSSLTNSQTRSGSTIFVARQRQDIDEHRPRRITGQRLAQHLHAAVPAHRERRSRPRPQVTGPCSTTMRTRSAVEHRPSTSDSTIARILEASAARPTASSRGTGRGHLRAVGQTRPMHGPEVHAGPCLRRM